MRNPDLDVDTSRLAAWNRPGRRRESFRNLHNIHRRGLTFCAPEVLQLAPREEPLLAHARGLSSLMSRKEFCGLCVVQGIDILLERCAKDFTIKTHHSMQSITKTFVPLLLGRLGVTGKLKNETKIGAIIPEVGPAYCDVSVQDALDMNVSNNFAEDYEAPYSPAPQPGAPVGYAREEIAMGWRLPPPGEDEFGVRDFAATLHPAARPAEPVTQYKSANTDVLGWIVEVVSKLSLTAQIDAVARAAGFEDAFHISTDHTGVPVLSGGGVLTLRDLARLGLLFARGKGIDGQDMQIGGLVSDALSGKGTLYRTQPAELRYRNHMLASPSEWIGHPGYGGQFLMVSPLKNAAIAFFSVLESHYGDEEGYFDTIMLALAHILETL